MPETGKPEEKTGVKEIRISAEIEKYATALAKDPKSRAFAPLAEAYRRAGMLDEAVMVAQDGLKIHPAYHSGRVALGRAYFEKGMLSEALQELENVTKVSPDNIVAQKVLGEIYFRRGEKEKAKRLFSLVLTLSPGDKEAEEKLKALAQPESQPVPEPHPLPEPEPETERFKGSEFKVQKDQPVSEPEPETKPVPIPESESSRAEPKTEMIAEPEDLVSEAFSRAQAEEIEAKPESVPRPEPELEPEPSEAPSRPEPEKTDELEIEDDAQPAVETEPGKPSDLSDQSDLSDLVPGPEPALEPEPETERFKGSEFKVQKDQPVSESEIATPTIAEIYVKQGLLDKALNVYREILKENPGARDIIQRVVELSRLVPGGAAAPPDAEITTGETTLTERKIRILKNWLENIQRIRGETH